MQINGNIEIKGFLTIEDLDYGDTFAFDDDNTLYLLGVNELDYPCVIDLENGKILDADDNKMMNRPIHRINAKVII